MRFVVEFEANNAAFDDGNLQGETARIVKAVADTIEGGYFQGQNEMSLWDINGNFVGSAYFEE